MGQASRTKNERRWTPFQPAIPTLNGQIIRDHPGRILRNNLYTVHVTDLDHPQFGPIRWLSIKRNDRQPIHDWRDLQAIKRDLCGPEIEAIELYPAASRTMDTANQYHLWAFMDGSRFSLGLDERLVLDPDEPIPDDAPRPSVLDSVQLANLTSNAVQRPFAPGRRP